MTMAKIFAGGVGLVALASATPAIAQMYSFGVDPEEAADRCAAAVDNRRNVEVVSVTSVDPRRNFVRVHGIATTGYGPYGIGAYGLLGSGYRANVSFSCDVDYRGFVRDIDIYSRGY